MNDPRETFVSDISERLDGDFSKPSRHGEYLSGLAKIARYLRLQGLKHREIAEILDAPLYRVKAWASGKRRSDYLRETA